MIWEIKSRLNDISYKAFVKPIVFQFDPEKVHDFFVFTGRFLGSNFIGRGVTRFLFDYENKRLEQTILGMNLKNPVGLAAGFDYEGYLVKILPEVGFGTSTIGSVTFGSYGGNAKPRLGRLPKSKSLLVNKGLKSSGAANVIERIKKLEKKISLGVSIAKTNCKVTADEEEGIRDYIESFRLWEKEGIADYYELNISCPNAFGGEPFTTPKKLDKLLKELDKLKIRKPVLLKMPSDFSIKETEKLCNVAKRHKVEGLIFGNLTKNRNNGLFDKEEIGRAGKGNFSGIPVKDNVDRLIIFARKKYGKRFVIVGTGGIFSSEDAYNKIKLGADFVQLITGMIYNGPGVIGNINKGIIDLMDKEGYKNIRDVVGKGI